MPHPATWSIAEAKAHFSEVLAQASAAPQTITRNGKRTAVVVSAEDWDRHARREGSLVDFLNRSPLRGSGLTLDRSKDGPRDIEL